MTQEEKIQKIKETYHISIRQLEGIERDIKTAVADYIKELESRKIEAIRSSILSN